MPRFFLFRLKNDLLHKSFYLNTLKMINVVFGQVFDDKQDNPGENHYNIPFISNEDYVGKPYESSTY